MAALRQLRPDTGLYRLPVNPESGGRNLLSDILTGGASSGALRQAHRFLSSTFCPELSVVLAAHCLRQHLARLLKRYRLPCVRPECRATTYATRKVAEQLIRDQPQVGINKPMDRLLSLLAASRSAGSNRRCRGQQTRRTLDVLATLRGKRRRWQIRHSNPAPNRTGRSNHAA